MKYSRTYGLDKGSVTVGRTDEQTGGHIQREVLYMSPAGGDI